MYNCNSKLKSDLRQRCFIFSRNIISLMDKLPDTRAYRIISGQLIRSATSIAANLYEAQAAGSRREYKKHFEISLKSANETKFWLNLLQEIGGGHQKNFDTLSGETKELASILAKSILTLKKDL